MYAWIVTSSYLFGSVPRQQLCSERRIHHERLQPKAGTRLRPSVTGCAQINPQVNVPPTESRNTPRQVKVLPLEVVQRIAAGEVITGYDSVVQELVENSIDANAKAIRIDIDLVTRSIIVQDDGVGISYEQGLADIARCNATSKLRTLSELTEGVRTLGFRGQGLWAIAMTAARLEICSRTSNSLCGKRVVFRSDGSPQEDSISPAAMSPGTSATVTGLPWSTEPVDARKVMKRCKEWLLRAALCNPTREFNLTRNGKTVWRTVRSGGNEDEARIRLLAQELKLQPGDFRTASRSIPGVCEMSIVVGTPSTVHSSSKTWMMTAINGRCVGVHSIRRAMSNAIDVRKGRYPVAFVNIVAKAGLVNWNVSPVKTTIRLNSATVEEILVATASSLLKNALQGALIAGIQKPYASDTSSLFDDSGTQGGVRGVISLLARKTSLSDGTDSGNRNDGIGSEDETDAMPISMLQARVVAQVLNTYILIEHNGGIILTEQHVADERIRYEGLLQSWRNSAFVPLKEPVKLPKNMKAEWIFTLTTLGLVSDEDGDDMGMDGHEIVAVPEAIADITAPNLLSLVLQVCAEGSSIEEACASVSCRLAVKNGTALNMRQMESIVRKLVRCGNPFTCPHGRPIFIELQTTELARLFGRSWVPERSKDDAGTTLRRRGVLNE